MDFPSTDFHALFRLKGSLTRGGFHVLDKAICLLDGYLGQPTVSVESVEKITFGDFLRGKITDEKAGARWKLVPNSFCHVSPFFLQKMVI